MLQLNGLLLWEPPLYRGLPILGPGHPDLAEDHIRGDGCGARDAAPASGGCWSREGGGDDATSGSFLPERPQGRLPQLLLEDLHLVLVF